jgi:tRNA threonylcarbamoyladenosine biosynthesis protein TsaE
MIEVIETNSPEETEKLGRKLASEASPGQVFTLIGDLGVGKTVFTQGFAEGLEIDEAICSPTFTIVQVYDTGRLPFYHFDVYRIGDIEEIDEIGYEIISMEMASLLLSGLILSPTFCLSITLRSQ